LKQSVLYGSCGGIVASRRSAAALHCSNVALGSQRHQMLSTRRDETRHESGAETKEGG